MTLVVGGGSDAETAVSDWYYKPAKDVMFCPCIRLAVFYHDP